jgi:hypothetical protein
MGSAPYKAALSAVLLISTFSLTSVFVSAQTTPQIAVPSCGWNNPVNRTQIVASSLVGSSVMISIGAPSWEQGCYSSPASHGATAGVSFPEYEVFPITIRTSPNTTVNLQAGSANPTALQMTQYGVYKSAIWTWFDPNSVVTNSSGIATSNMTLVGAVMPFKPNDLSNVTLPIIASTTTAAANATAGLPIEFVHDTSGGLQIIKSAGPLTFGSGLSGQAGVPSQPLLAVVFSPPDPSSGPIQVSLQVLGTYDNGNTGQMPSGLHVSFPYPTFELKPNSVFYIPVAENNSLTPSNSSSSATYTLAIQEKFGNVTYVEPMRVTIQLSEIFASSFGPSFMSLPPKNRLILGPFVIPLGETDFVLVLTAIVAAVAAIFGIVISRRTQQKEERMKSAPV